MHQQSAHRHSIFCVMPPHLLRMLARTGEEEERTAALEALGLDTTFRTLRAVRLATPVAAAVGATATVSAGTAEAGHKQRTIFNCHTSQDLSGRRVTQARYEGQSETHEPAVDEAYDGLGATYDFYQEMLHRNSIDDQGMALNGYVHFGERYPNAFWDGQEMVFGDGDGVRTNRFTISIDIMGHELTHGVTENTANLLYQNQSGALNESISDVFGSLVKQYANGKEDAEAADWLIGEGIFTEQFSQRIHGVALRSMKDPGHAHDGDPQPANMRDYVHTIQDNGGVHTNSGIPNKAFHLAATGMGGYAGVKAGRIWYAALLSWGVQQPNATRAFQEFAKLTVANAQTLFPSGEEQQIVRDAWEQVGIPITE
jgi:Zn-dependent metalloprotease